MNEAEAKKDVIKLQRDVAGGMRTIIDNLDKDADAPINKQHTNAWRIANKERLETLKEIYHFLTEPVKVFEEELRSQERAKRLEELREDPDVIAYLRVAADDRVQEYIQLAKGKS